MNDSITKKDVIACISKECKSSFQNHLLTFILGWRAVSGEINERNILIWNTNSWMGAWFPVFNFEFNSQLELINISQSRNWFAKFLNVIFYAFMVVGCIYIFSFIDYSIKSFILPLIFLIVICLGKFLFHSLYRFESKNQLEELYHIIGIENNLNPEPKAKPLTQLIIRLVFIPLSLLLLVGSYHFFKDGKILYGIFAILVAMGFLVSDFLIILKKDN